MGYLREAIETMGLLIEEHGLLGLALLPFCHIGYVDARYEKFKGSPSFEMVVRDGSQLPEGAIVTKELKDGQFLGKDHIVRNEGEDWIAGVHTDGPTSSRSGNWPEKGVRMEGTSGLSRDEANELANRTLLGK